MDFTANKTNCFDKILRKFFRLYATFMQEHGRFAILPVVLSLLATLGLGMGFMFIECEYGFEALYVPEYSRAYRDQKIGNNLFPLNFSRFQPNRVYDTHQIQISVAITAEDDGNLLRIAQLQSVLEFNDQVLSFPIPHQHGNSTYKDLCSEWNSTCVWNPLIVYLDETVANSSANEDNINVPYPKIIDDQSGTEELIDYYLGDATVVNGSAIYARFILIEYFLRGGPDEELSRSWERAVHEDFSTRKFPLIEVAISSSNSLDEAQDELLSSAVPYFSGSFILMAVLGMVSCLMLRDYVMSKPWLPLVAVVTVAMAVISAIGLLSFCGLPFNQPSLVMPFLVLWMGLHHVFFMISTWRYNNISGVNNIIQEILEFTGTSITASTITEITIFFICASSSVPVIRTFCLYTGVTLVFHYIYQFTILAPVVLVFARIEVANRHSCTCLKVRARDNTKNIKIYKLFCAGGNDKSAVKLVHFANTFFETTYTSKFTNRLSLVGFAIFFLICVVISIVGAALITVGMETKNMVPTASHAYSYFDLRSQQLADIGPFVSVVFSEDLNYWEKDVQREVEDVISLLEKSDFVKPSYYTQCWFRDYYHYVDKTRHDKDDFFSNLADIFLDDPKHVKYQLDINFKESDTISSSRCILSTQNVTTPEKQSQMMQELRHTVSDSVLSDTIVIFAPEFIFYEQQIILPSEIRNINLIAGLCTLGIALLCIPNPFVAICVFLMVMSMLTCVTGFMSYWGVSLDAVSIINLLLCIGISVEFTTHCAYAYTYRYYVSDDPPRSLPYAYTYYGSDDPPDRLNWSLGIFGFPVSQSALCALLGLIVFIAFPAYFYQSFAKIIFLTISFGLLHSLMFFPTILMIIFKEGSQQGNHSDPPDMNSL